MRHLSPEHVRCRHARRQQREGRRRVRHKSGRYQHCGAANQEGQNSAKCAGGGYPCTGEYYPAPANHRTEGKCKRLTTAEYAQETRIRLSHLAPPSYTSLPFNQVCSTWMSMICSGSTL